MRAIMAFSDYSTGESCKRTYYVGGESTYDELALGRTVASVTLSRNTSHLHFEVSQLAECCGGVDYF